jgi:hypothetical protein
MTEFMQHQGVKDWQVTLFIIFCVICALIIQVCIGHNLPTWAVMP